jgi:hypothetical protein
MKECASSESAGPCGLSASNTRNRTSPLCSMHRHHQPVSIGRTFFRYHESREGFPMKVFISHSYADRAVAALLADALEARTLEAWTSARLHTETDWKAAIRQAIAQSQGFLFVIGPQSEEDRWQQVEWQAVLESDWDRVPPRPMISILLGDVATPAFLADRVALRPEGSMDFPVDRIVHLLLHPEETRLPVNYDQARQEQKQRLDLLKQFALSLKLAGQHPEGPSFSR